MKTLIIALNSKYIHSALAPWYLKAACGPECGEVRVMESTVNDDPGVLLSSIYRERPDVAAFSCYIWNIRYVLALVSNLKKVLPRLVVILGGPEVSYDPDEILAVNTDIDCIITGEGEEAFPKLMIYLNGHGLAPAIDEIEGLCYRNPYGTSHNSPALIREPDSVPSPYTPEMLEAVGNRIVYYESSRGCPFLCSYCLSSTFAGVRYFSMERVKRELTMLFERGIRQVKFVDRTFNCNKTRAMEIFRHITGLYLSRLAKEGGKPEINFHFEAAADLFDAEMLELLAQVPAGLIQLEIGVQTVNEAALEAIDRRTDIKRLCENVRELRAAGNINLHLDLIAGLPLEDMASFGNSFDTVYGLAPHQLQLGFLKLLKGTRIRRQANLHDYKFSDHPPYEVLANKFISFDELSEMKGVEELLDRYYNSGRFVSTLDFLLQFAGSAFDFYLGFYRFNLSRGRARLPAAMKELYTVLFEYAADICGSRTDAVMEFMRLDFLSSDSSGCLPPMLARPLKEAFRDSCFEFLKKEENINRYLPGFSGLPAKTIYKKVRFELFNLVFSSGAVCFDPAVHTLLLFDYSEKDRVSGLYRYTEPDGFLV